MRLVAQPDDTVVVGHVLASASSDAVDKVVYHLQLGGFSCVDLTTRVMQSEDVREKFSKLLKSFKVSKDSKQTKT